MKIALVSTMVPFIDGGARNIVNWLSDALLECGHQVEIVWLPSSDEPDLLFQQMMGYRWIDLSAADRVICFRPQAHFIQHDCKVLWFIHHIRYMYDLWGTQYSDLKDNPRNNALRKSLFEADTRAIAEAKSVFSNSKVVRDRLKTYNNVDAEILYPPLINAERFSANNYNDEIVYIARIEGHKRQKLLVEAMLHTKTDVKLRVMGVCSNPSYLQGLEELITGSGLSGRVTLDHRWVPEREKVDIINEALAAAYLPFEEDSYGYPSLEASHASKCILTTTDSGGVPELVSDGLNGLVVEPTPEALAEGLDRLYLDRQATIKMGEAAKARLSELNISWAHTVERLLS